MADIAERLLTIAVRQIILRSEKMVTDLVMETPIDTGEARAGWKVRRTSKGVNITNDVDHITDLNEGSSQQAPSNFIEYTMMKYGKVKPR